MFPDHTIILSRKTHLERCKLAGVMALNRILDAFVALSAFFYLIRVLQRNAPLQHVEYALAFMGVGLIALSVYELVTKYEQAPDNLLNSVTIEQLLRLSTAAVGKPGDIFLIIRRKVLRRYFRITYQSDNQPRFIIRGNF